MICTAGPHHVRHVDHHLRLRRLRPADPVRGLLREQATGSADQPGRLHPRRLWQHRVDDAHDPHDGPTSDGDHADREQQPRRGRAAHPADDRGDFDLPEPSTSRPGAHGTVGHHDHLPARRVAGQRHQRRRDHVVQLLAGRHPAAGHDRRSGERHRDRRPALRRRRHAGQRHHHETRRIGQRLVPDHSRSRGARAAGGQHGGRQDHRRRPRPA